MNPSITTKKRFWEIDFIRGIAIILMVVFHLIVDLKDFYAYDLEYLTGFWYLEGKLSAILFILICGVSTTLGHKSTHHGIITFLWAMLLTVATYFFNKNCYILFGILHFLGASLLSAHFMNKLPLIWLSLLSGSSIILGTLWGQRFVATPYLFPLGLTTNTFISLDYYPLFPWYGVFVFGIILGKLCYRNENRNHHQVSLPSANLITKLGSTKFSKGIIQLGQHSLAIYLLHQPLLLAFLYLIHTVFFILYK